MKRYYLLMLALGVMLSLTLISMSSQAFNTKVPAIKQVEKLSQARQISYSAVQNSSYNVRSAQEEFNVRQAFADHLDMLHVRMDQTHKGVKVFKGELITHFNADGSLSSISGEYYRDINISTVPQLNADQAFTIANKEFDHTLSNAPNIELMVLPQDNQYQLAYRVELMDIESDHPAAHVYFVGANDGKVLYHYNNLETAATVGSGNSLYSGNVPLNTNSKNKKFQMMDVINNGSYTVDMRNFRSGKGKIFTDKDNVWGTSLATDTASAGVDAHYGLQVTFDYYRTVHNRNGIFDSDKGTYSRVHYGRKFNNAFWSDGCSCMTYGDGDNRIFLPLVALDVAGHEITHGVTSATAGLIYDNQSGALNEATSDIFGTSVEFFANNDSDPGDYLIGEEVALFNDHYLRNMKDPRADGESIDHFSQYKDWMDVHNTSGLANIFFYLLSEGGTNKTSGQSVTGITRAKAEQIWYRALTVYMTSGTTFAQARTATLNAARDLYGADSPEISAVAATWTACGVE